MNVKAVLLCVGFDKLIRTETGFARLAVHERIGKTTHMAARHPGLGVHQDRSVHADVVGTLLHEFTPPGTLDVVFEFYAQRAVIPRVGEAAVDLAAGVNKAAPFAQSDDLIHGFFTCHNPILLLNFHASIIRYKAGFVKAKGAGQAQHFGIVRSMG